MAKAFAPILLPVNYVGGRNVTGDFKAGATDDDGKPEPLPPGLDTLAWGNVSPAKTDRYWAHLWLAVGVVIWVCYVFFAELRVYIRVRQDYLTSAEHRLRALATMVLVTSIPDKWLTIEALSGLYDVCPGGIRNIWINRNYDSLREKVRLREQVVSQLEQAETELIRKCKRAQMKQQKRDRDRSHRKTKQERELEGQASDEAAEEIARGEGVTAGDPHQIRHTVEEAVEEDRRLLRPTSIFRREDTLVLERILRS